jgi:PAS domain S-box-containing protein
MSLVGARGGVLPVSELLTLPEASHMIEQLADAVVLADVDGVIQLWNPGAERVFGHSAADAVGQSLDLIVPERFLAAHEAGRQRAVGDHEVHRAERPLTVASVRADGSKDGVEIYVEISLSMLLDHHRRVIGTLAVIRDITERYRQELELRLRISELEQGLAEG